MIIDAHHHLWQIGQNEHSWPTEDLGEIYRDFLPPDLMAASQGTGVTGTLLVQSQPSDADTRWLLSVADTSALIKGVIGWADLAAPGAVSHITALAQHPKLKGLRPMLQGLPEDDWILRPELAPALDAMVALDLRFDALVFTRHLPFIDTLAKRYPGLRIIIDHGAKPPIACRSSHPEQTQTWRDYISQVAQNPNLTCKLSGLFTEMGPGQAVDEVTPYADHLLDCFGGERLMWGSDWPVLLLKDSYRDWMAWTLDWLKNKPDSVKSAILGETAHMTYHLM